MVTGIDREVIQMRKLISFDAGQMRNLLPTLKHLIPFAAVALGLIGSFFLPNAVAGVMDGRRLDNLILIEAQSMSFESAPDLNISKRIALSANPNADILALTTGQTMEREAAEKTAIRELAKFFSGTLFEFAYNGFTVEEGSALFVVDSEDPMVNIIIWEFRILDRNGNMVTMTIDDETGMILRLIYQKGSGYLAVASEAGTDASGLSDIEMLNIVTLLTKSMTSYYGIPVSMGDYYFGGSLAYYRADILGTGTFIPVPMYGVVRSTGFTMNERV